MPDARRTKLVRDLWLHKGRTLMVVLAMVVGLTAAGAVLDAHALVTRAVDTGYQPSNPPGITLVLDRLDQATLDATRERPQIRDAEARRTLSGSIWIGSQRRELVLFVADDPGATRIGRITPVRGSWPPAPGQLAIERSSLPLADVAPGDELTVKTPGGRRSSLGVAAIVHDVGLAPGWMEQVVYAYASSSTLELLGESPALDELRLTVTDDGLDRAALRRIAASLTADLERDGRVVRAVTVPEPGEHVHEGQMRSFFFVLGAMGLMALLLCGALVASLVTAILAGHAREIGIMKAIGARTGQIAGYYLVMVTVLGLVSSTIAIPLSAAVGRMRAEQSAAMLNFDLGELGVPAWAMVVQVIAGVGVPLLAASVPILRASRMTVAQALRVHDTTRPRLRSRRVPRHRVYLSRSLALSLRDALQRRGRLVLTVLPLALGGALFIGALGLRVAVVESIDAWFRPVRYDATVLVTDDAAPERLEAAVGQIPGVLEVEAWRRTSATRVLPDGTRGDAFVLTGPPSSSALLARSLAEGRWMDGPAQLVVNTAWTRRIARVRPGDTLTLSIAGHSASWLVVGIAEGSPLTPVAYALPDALDDADGDASTNVLVRIDPDDPGLVAHVEMLRQLERSGDGRPTAMHHHAPGPRAAGTAEERHHTLADAPRLFAGVLRGAGFTVSSSASVQTARDGLRDHLVMVVELLRAMSLLAIVVGGLGLAVTTSLGVLERTREIGILRALGASHRSIVVVVTAGAVLMAALAWAIAVPLSIPIGAVLGRAFGEIMFHVPLPLAVDPWAPVVWLAWSVVVAGLASIWPSVRATRIRPREALEHR